MSNDIFDYFGGTAERPDEPGEDELDLSDLDELAQESQQSAEEDPVPESNELNVDAEATDADSDPPSESGSGESDATHWLDLASSLGVAIESTEFSTSPSEPPARPAPRPPAKKPKREKRPPNRDEDEVIEPVFGQGLLDDIEPTPEEEQQENVLSEMFPAPAPEAEEAAEDVELIDEPELIDDPDIVEFEIEELTAQTSWRTERETARPPRVEETAIDPADVDEDSERPARPAGREQTGGGRERGGRRRRRRRPDRRHENSATAVSGQSKADDAEFDADIDNDDHRSDRRTDLRSMKFPTWIETISPIVEGNIARRKKGKDRRRPRRGR